MDLETAKRAFLATRYDPDREAEAETVLAACPHLTQAVFAPEDCAKGKAIAGSTPLHYAANDGRLGLIGALLDLGADPNADGADWYRTPLAWAANNARVEAIRLLLARGAAASSLDALHAAAWGGSSRWEGRAEAYAQTIVLLIAAGADPDDRRNAAGESPLEIAREAGHKSAIEALRRAGAH